MTFLLHYRRGFETFTSSMNILWKSLIADHQWQCSECEWVMARSWSWLLPVLIASTHWGMAILASTNCSLNPAVAFAAMSKWICLHKLINRARCKPTYLSSLICKRSCQPALVTDFTQFLHFNLWELSSYISIVFSSL